MSWQEIIKYREWALLELRIEAKRFNQSGVDVKPNNLTFTDIWVKCVDAEEIKMKGIGKNNIFRLEDIELSFKEKTILYETLSMDFDKTLMSFMNGGTVDRDSLKLKCNLQLAALTLIVTELITKDDEEREREFRSLNFLDNCRCTVCLEKISNKISEAARNRESRFVYPKQHSEEINENHNAESEYMLDQSRAFENHSRDLYQDSKLELNAATGDLDDAKHKKTKKDVRFNENAQLNECLNIVCFVEVLGVEGTISTKRDGSVVSDKAISVTNLMIFDTTLISKVAEYVGLQNDPYSEKVKFTMAPKNKKSKEYSASGQRGHLEESLYTEYKDSRILSKDVFEGILK